MNAKLFKRLEIIGFFVIFATATFLHFYYDIGKGNIFSIIFGAVNESVWENIKIFMMPYLAWGVIELFWAKTPLKKFTVAKVIGLYFLIIANIVGFYFYNFFTHGPILFFDIGLAVVWLALSLYISYRLTNSDKKISNYFPTACVLLFLFIVMYFSFSVFPPKIDLFLDKNTGIYGLK